MSPTEDRTAQVFNPSFGEMFTFFFLMLGPLKILGPFTQMTRKGDAVFGRRFAVRAFAFSCVALLLAAVLGENQIRMYHIPIAVLVIAGGIILFLVALRTVMEQFDATAETSQKVYEADLKYALFPMTFPTIVTPYGVNVHNDYYGGGGYYGGGCCYHPVATAAAVTAATMATAAIVGSIVNSLPPSCSATMVNGITYQHCGSTWYQPQFSGGNATYVVVNQP